MMRFYLGELLRAALIAARIAAIPLVFHATIWALPGRAGDGRGAARGELDILANHLLLRRMGSPMLVPGGGGC